MSKNQAKTIFDTHRVQVILFIYISIYFTPLIAAISFLFDLQELYSINSIVAVSAITQVIIIIIGTVFVLSLKRKTRRTFKPNYKQEYIFIWTVNLLGITGFAIIAYLYAIPLIPIFNVLLPILLVSIIVLEYLGKQYFNVKIFE